MCASAQDDAGGRWSRAVSAGTALSMTSERETLTLRSDMATVSDVRALARPLPRSEEVYVRDRLKYRVRGIVYLALSRDETIMGFGYSKEERIALVASDPTKFLMPDRSDERYHWVQARLEALDVDELREIVHDAWRMVVPRFLAVEHLGP